MDEQQNYITPLLSEFNIKLQDLEEKQRLMKERIMLIGENLIETKQETEETLSNINSFLETLKNEVLKIKETLTIIAEQMDNFARRNEVEILKKQSAMFQPLELVTKKEVQEMLKHKKT